MSTRFSTLTAMASTPRAPRLDRFILFCRIDFGRSSPKKFDAELVRCFIRALQLMISPPRGSKGLVKPAKGDIMPRGLRKINCSNSGLLARAPAAPVSIVVAKPAERSATRARLSPGGFFLFKQLFDHRRRRMQ